MTKYAPTPAGRAAAAADMAATGTTMGPRPSGPKAATSIKAPNATQASPRRRMAGDPSRSRPTLPAGAGRYGSKNPSAPPQASSQYSPPGNMSPALRQKLQARNAAGAKGQYSAQVGANSGRSPSMAQKPTPPKSSYQKGDAFKNQPNRAAPTVGGRRMNVGGAASTGYADRAAGYADRAVASAPMPAYMAQGRDDQARIVRNPVNQESRAVNLANKRAGKKYYNQASAPYRTPGRYGGAGQMVRPGVMGGLPPVSAPQAPAKSGSIYGNRGAEFMANRAGAVQAPMGPRTPVAKPLPPRPSAAEGKPAFSPNVSYSQPPGATNPTPRTQDFAGLSSLEKATGQSMADFRQRQAAQNAAIIGNSTGSKPVGGAPGQLPGTVGGAPISQRAATQQAATQSGVGTPFSKPSFFKKGGAVKSKAMRGGGLARKGVGMALAKGGLARRAGGCAQRGVGRGKIT